MKKSIWIKGSELRKMTNSQLAKYEFNARITNPDEHSDHELLLMLVNKVSNIETKLTNVETRLTDIETRLDKHDEMFKAHGWMK